MLLLAVKIVASSTLKREEFSYETLERIFKTTNRHILWYINTDILRSMDALYPVLRMEPNGVHQYI